jgi:hypothetical protein
MPLPLLVPVALGLLGLFGVGKTVKAVVDNSDASDYQQTAQKMVDDANTEVQTHKNKANNNLVSLGKFKVDVLNTTLSDFTKLYRQVGQIKPINCPEMEKIFGSNFDPEKLIGDIENSCAIAQELALGAAGGLSAGALTAFAAYGGTMAFASAGTGAAISGLFGAAASNATLAWLGGGTLASGGLGIAGGTAVLGILVAGPALAILGCVLGSKASENLSNAKANVEKAKTFRDEAKTITLVLSQIYDVATLAKDTLDSASGQLKSLLQVFPIFFPELDATTVNTEYFNKMFYILIRLAQCTNAVINTPILSENGSLLPSAEMAFLGIKDELKLISYN